MCTFNKPERDKALERLQKMGLLEKSQDKIEQKQFLHRLLEGIWIARDQATRLKFRPAISFWIEQIQGWKIKEGMG